LGNREHVATVMRKRETATGNERFILSSGAIDGRPAVVSNSVTSATATFGDWSQIVIAW
jgi:hypothetical protein